MLPIYFDNKGKINFDKVYYLEKLPNQDGSTSNLGGGMEIYNNSIYLSVGTTAIPDELEKNILAQDNKTFFGKILKIPYSFDGSSMDLGKAMIISKGHRNSQGFKFFGNKLLSVEHGPRGGDEINLIRTDEKNIYNYGWPDFSYGLLYSSQTPYKSDNSSLESNSNVRVDNYEHYYNNKNTNYIDPIFHFTPSIGISDIAECPFKSSKYQQYSSCFLISSLKGESFYVMKLLENQKNNNVNIHSVEKVFVGSRIRKIYTENNTVYLFLDNLKVIKILYNTK